MYNLISKVSAIDEDTGESIEIEFHQEQIVNDLGTTTITINNNLYITSRSEIVYPVSGEDGYFFCKDYDPVKYFRVSKS